ncbi:hypothetical protein ACEQ8H_003645 [Pleosporales sp. CAS-2024a]
MDNQQFRRLLLSDTRRQDGDKAKGKGTAPAAGTPTAALGARKHSSIPMTPRPLARGSLQADFARQLAERNAKARPQKQARASAPKGTRLAAGYTDRTKERADTEDSDLAKRIRNLEEATKLGQMDRDTFARLVQEMTGGHVGTTHLVKGLDRKLLARVRRGEDVLAAGADGDAGAESDDAPPLAHSPAVDEALDALADAELGPIVRQRTEKKGDAVAVVAPPPAVAGVKRSRNDILKDLKRQREEAAAAAAAEHERKFPSLGPGFRKISARGETSRIEVDDKGREVLIVAGPDGKEKRKVRKQKADEQPAPPIRNDLDDAAKPINMHNLPEAKKEESEDEDIFAGVGSNYNPLADLADEDDDGDDDSEEGEQAQQMINLASNPLEHPVPSPDQTGEATAEGTTTAPSMKRDYFKTSTHKTPADSDLSAADVTVRAALAKVRNLDESSTLLHNLSSAQGNAPESTEARLRKRAAELAASDRDMEDLDLGFGASRFDDADDMEREGEKVKFSQWKGLGAEGDEDDVEGGGRDAKKQRKRGPKKKRGDKNKAEDVLNAMQRQKEKQKKLG